MRRSHWLKGNKGSPLPQNCIWVDTETRERRVSRNTVSHHLWFGWAVWQRTATEDQGRGTTWKRFESQLAFWRWVISKTRPKTRLYVFAHNWAFDAPVLATFRILPSLGWTLQRAIIESPPVILVWRKGDRVIEMLDTLNWWRHTLKSIGRTLGLDKLKMPALAGSKSTWDRYCRNDVEIIRRACLGWWDFLRVNDLGGFARTLAGQAMRSYRHRYMDHPILIDADARALALARSAFHGGRTEAFRIGKVKGPVHCLDVNSMYPFVMLDRLFPSELKAVSVRPSLKELARWLKRYAIVARVRLETKEPRYAHRQGDKLVFPVGRLITTLTSPDLLSALKHGEIAMVESAAVYVRGQLFHRFVTDLYARRQEATARGDDVSRYQLKILMNSLYGKWAQRGTVWETCGDTSDPSPRSWIEFDADTGTRRLLRQFGGTVQFKADDPEAPASHPAIAAHVTAYAREFLWRLMLRAGKGNVLYCDTDSLYVTSEGRRRLDPLIDAERLGALKVEATYPWLRIHGAKDYETPDGRVCKGIRDSAVSVGHNAFLQDKWASLSGLLRTGQLEAPTTQRQLKRLSRIYSKGIVHSGGVVSPLTLREW